MHAVTNERGIRIFLSDDIGPEELQGSVFITGFKGFGAAGYIATKYLVYKLDMQRIGMVTVGYMPEFSFRDEYGLAFPFEIFRDPDSNTVVLLNHDIPDAKERSAYAEIVTKWLRDIGVRKEILIGGLDKKFRIGEEELRVLPTSWYREVLSDPLMDKWLLIIGPLALFLMYAELYGIPALTVLPYVEAFRHDPRAAAIAVRKVGGMLGVEIDVSELYEEAKRFEEELEKLAKAVEKEGGKESIYM